MKTPHLSTVNSLSSRIPNLLYGTFATKSCKNAQQLSHVRLSARNFRNDEWILIKFNIGEFD
jgi:hypothetical protein